MADKDREFGSVVGIVQQFKDKPTVEVRETTAGDVYDFKLRSIASQGLVSVGAFASDYPGLDEQIEAGALVSVDGPVTTNEKNGVTYVNFTAWKLTVTNPIARVGRETTNKSKGTKGTKAPF